jgi:hypothetical protein
MVWLDEEFGGIGKGVVGDEPVGVGMAMRTDDRQVADFSVEPTGDVAGDGKRRSSWSRVMAPVDIGTWLTSWTINNGVVLQRSDH